MACFYLNEPFYPKRVKLLKQYFCGLSCWPHLQTDKESSAADILQSFVLLTIHTQIFLLLSLSSASWKPSEKGILCPACSSLFWIYPRSSPPQTHTPCIHKINIIVREGVWPSSLSGMASWSRTGLWSTSVYPFKRSQSQAYTGAPARAFPPRDGTTAPSSLATDLSLSLTSPPFEVRAGTVNQSSGSYLCQKAGELAFVFHSLLLHVALTCPASDGCWGKPVPTGPLVSRVAGHPIPWEAESKWDLTLLNGKLNFVKGNHDLATLAQSFLWHVDCLTQMPSQWVNGTVRQSLVGCWKGQGAWVWKESPKSSVVSTVESREPPELTFLCLQNEDV